MEYNNYITYSCGTDSLRLETINGEPWFFATDLVRLLEGKADHTAYKTKKVPDHEKKLVKRQVKSGVRNVYLVNQLGFTTLSSESKCSKERVEEILDLMFDAIWMLRRKSQPFDVAKERKSEALIMQKAFTIKQPEEVAEVQEKGKNPVAYEDEPTPEETDKEVNGTEHVKKILGL